VVGRRGVLVDKAARHRTGIGALPGRLSAGQGGGVCGPLQLGALRVDAGRVHRQRHEAEQDDGYDGNDHDDGAALV
jgi:hypothetical protein